jgi:choline/glycine/proline betaine transport protein
MTASTPAADPLASRPLARWVFWPAAVVIVGVAAFAIAVPDVAEQTFATIQSTIVRTFSWYYVLIAAFFVAFALVLGFSRFGDIKLGKDDDEPEFSTGAWFSLLFAAGMGIGLVFYGVSEPLSHFVSPRPGVTGTEAQLAQSALIQTYLHWGVQAWAIYVVIGVALAYAIHRRRRPVSIRWALEPLLGKRVRGTWGNVIDTLALVGTVFGVATSLGLGVLQIGAGLRGFGTPDTADRDHRRHHGAALGVGARHEVAVELQPDPRRGAPRLHPVRGAHRVPAARVGAVDRRVPAELRRAELHGERLPG